MSTTSSYAETFDGVIVDVLSKHVDQRGWLAELFRNDSDSPLPKPEMGYISYTHKGQRRGPHEHVRQSDVFVFLGPYRLFLWDNRESSATYGIKTSFTFNQHELVRVVIPPGVVHAYLSLDGGLVMNFPDALYGGDNRRSIIDEIRHEDDPSSPFRLWDVDSIYVNGGSR